MTFDTLRLDKGLYTSEKGFTKALEEIDPSENYKGTELEGLDAYERQLKRFDIKVSGQNSDPVSKFFQTSDSAVLFPEYIKRSVTAAMVKNDIVDKIVATTTVIDSLDYRSVQCQSVDPENIENAFINEGAFIPETVIKTKEHLTKLKKNGRTLVASYESIKSQRLDLFAVMLKQIGNYINSCQLVQAIKALDSEDAPRIQTELVNNQVSFTDFANLYLELLPYEYNTLIVEERALARIIKLDEFRDGASGLDFHSTGKMITPFGAKIVPCATNIVGAGVVALDKNYALEKVQFGDVVTDFDKLIDRQIERATVTSTVGFNKIVDTACVVLDQH